METLRQLDSDRMVELILDVPTCTIKDEYLNKSNINEISTDIVKKILEQTFMNSVDMNAVICLFNTLLEKSKFSNGPMKPYTLTLSPEDTWLHNMQKIDSNSQYGIAYTASIINDINGISVVIKLAKKQDYEFELFREYIVGAYALNKLRYYVPTLAQVLGIFKCRKPIRHNPRKTEPEPVEKRLCNNETKRGGRGNTPLTPYVIYERVNGPSITSVIEGFRVTNDKTENKKSFKKLLEIFIQILITLEIGQQEYSFTHFDLHTSNVMSKEGSFEYSVSIDNNTYQIKTNTLPVIIDYGASSVKINEEVYGARDKEDAGIVNHMIPGFDMHRFLVSCLATIEDYHLDTDLVQWCRRLFGFYEKKDDYYKTEDTGVFNARINFSTLVSVNMLATYTPKMFLDWIIINHGETLGDIVKVEPRNIYMPIHPSILTNEYNKIFSKPSQGEEAALDILGVCSKLSPSYIMNRYTIHVLTKYNIETGLRVRKINQIIKSIEREIESDSKMERKRKMINVDMNFLNNYIKITIPTQQLINSLVPLVRVGRRNAPSASLTRNVDSLVQFKNEMKPYLEYLYTLREIGYDTHLEYIVWINDFSSSEAYIFYNDKITEIERVIRWHDVLTQA